MFVIGQDFSRSSMRIHEDAALTEWTQCRNMHMSGVCNVCVGQDFNQATLEAPFMHQGLKAFYSIWFGVAEGACQCINQALPQAHACCHAKE